MSIDCVSRFSSYILCSFPQVLSSKRAMAIFTVAIAIFGMHMRASGGISRAINYASNSTLSRRAFDILALMKSVLLGAQGKYNIFGIPTVFAPAVSGDISNAKGYMNMDNLERAFVNPFINTLVHEIGHALTMKAFGLRPKISIFNPAKEWPGYSEVEWTDPLVREKYGKLSKLQHTVIRASGSLFSGVFQSLFFILAFYILRSARAENGWPCSMLKVMTALKVMAAQLILRNAASMLAIELNYAIVSVQEHYEKGESGGDFGQIAKQGLKYLIPASALLIAEMALPFFSMIFILNREFRIRS